MGSWLSFLLAYLFGGITFIPLILLAVYLHATYTLPYRPDPSSTTTTRSGGSPERHDEDSLVQPGDETEALDEARRKEKEKKEKKSDLGSDKPPAGAGAATDYPDVSAGYFAVCREYTPMGINAKPIERPTPVGSTTVAAPSPSVYQTMYRSLFDRKAGPAGPVDNNSMNQRPKRAGNVFYLVLRHGHLMLFDDEEQIEVRHVISLAHHNVSIYSGGDPTPEGELFIKRNALCLSRRTDGIDQAPDAQVSKPFYLFSENCSAKEDFYFALLRNQEQSFGATMKVPSPKNFQVKDVISLVQKLHSTEDHLHTRWLNALLGRVFLSVYKTKDLENYISDKMTKKISRVNRPSFLKSITISKIDTGEAAPYFTNLKLKDLNVEGEYVSEADVKYSGNFRIEVVATAKIDLGARFKAREVNLVLSVTLKRIEGHILFKIKPPPSNRLWHSFQTMPKMEMRIEPVVSARQITYAPILRQIENRIKEVVAETLVQPFWDDLPFFNTEHKQWRGGIFEGDDNVATGSDHKGAPSSASAAARRGNADGVDRAEKSASAATSPGPGDEAHLPSPTLPLEKSYSVPITEMPAQSKSQPAGTGLFGRRMGKNTGNQTPKSPASASSTSLETKPAPSPASAPAPPAPAAAAAAAAAVAPSPKNLSQATTPVVGTDAAHADIYRPSTSPPDHATSYVAALHSRSQESSPAVTPGTSPAKNPPPQHQKQASHSSGVSTPKNGAKGNGNDADKTPVPTTSQQRRNTASSVSSTSTGGDVGGSGAQSPRSSKSLKERPAPSTLPRNFTMKGEGSTSTTSLKGEGADDSNGNGNGNGNGNRIQTQKKNTLAAVTNAAAQARQWGWNAIQRQKDGRKNGDGSSSPQVDLSQPMGRGQPFPPPGTPLPGPTSGKTKIAPIPVPKRRPSSTQAMSPGASAHESNMAHHHQGTPNDGSQRRRRKKNSHFEDEGEEQSILVVAAPDESDPETPAFQEGDGYDSSSELEAAGVMEEVADVPQRASSSSPSKALSKAAAASQTSLPLTNPASASKESDGGREAAPKDGTGEESSTMQAQIRGTAGDDGPQETASVSASKPDQDLSSSDDDEGLSRWMDDTPDEDTGDSSQEKASP
ncbi:putative integral membrane protein conserved region (DUF2404) [Geosmithia morbida]|uniref:Integral membrane protein conserved region (DUF2404) n=1 Tax=Geosmithia morbida TaxID=1094350 RepID=A0A9P4YNJ3_9HYPO|nr:putative integral membrane protein conserved region (DUF2404) [Geosmithia morbida]KAF4119850.1 putative integral membrane protein conserved region (DUF2404) [Geosmithia morbida]